MKKLVFFILCLFIYSSIQGQCPQGDVIITSQEDMDYFAATYPNCTVINGDFRFVGSSELGLYPTITVSDLPALERIEGELHFSTYTDMTNGFTGLTYVGGSLDSHIDLDGIFPALDTIGGDVANYGYNTLEESNLTASFPALKYVGGDFVTQGSEGGYIDSDEFPVLERIEGGLYDCTEYSEGITLSGFPALKYIGGDIEVENDTISGMNMVDTIAGSITFRRCDFIQVDIYITGLNELDYVGGGGFNFGSSNCVLDLSGLCNYFSNGGSFSISTFLPSGDCSISEEEALLPCTTCPTGGVILSTQQEVDEFGTTYPLCNTINGDLTIAEASPGSITNLNGLNQLDTIYGGIYIYNNEILADISGLEHVVYSEMTNLEIYDNAGLSTCSLSNLCNYLEAGGASNIYNNLAGCNSVPDIQANCPECPPPGNVELFNQQDLTDFIAFYPNCTTINGDLSIQANVNDISLLSELTTINGSLIVEDNNNLSDLADLQNINLIGGSLIINNCDLITDLNELSNLTSIGADLTISLNDMLISLAGLENITSLDGSLAIIANNQLTSLAGLENITSIGGYLRISSGNMTNLSGLENLTSVGDYLGIDNNNALINLIGLDNLTSINGDLKINYNDNLASLTGLGNLTSMNGNLTIDFNDNLASLTGLGNIDYSGIEIMFIRYNPNLSTCEVLTVCNYINIGGTLGVYSNATGCNNVTQIEEACQVFLPIEMTDPLRVHLKDKTAILQWRTATEINNAGFEIQRSKDGIQWEKIGWQSGQGDTSTPHSYTYTDPNPLFGTSYYRLLQVDTSGDSEYSNVVSLQYIHNSVTVYPNPVKGGLYLHTDHNFVQKITIYNTVGSQVAEIIDPGTDIDVSTLPKGVYVLKITIDDEDFYEKIIVE